MQIYLYALRYLEFLGGHLGFVCEQIVLFGSFARGDWMEDKYIENGTTYEYKSDYDLLFVVESEEMAHNKYKDAKRL